MAVIVCFFIRYGVANKGIEKKINAELEDMGNRIAEKNGEAFDPFVRILTVLRCLLSNVLLNFSDFILVGQQTSLEVSCSECDSSTTIQNLSDFWN